MNRKQRKLNDIAKRFRMIRHTWMSEEYSKKVTWKDNDKPVFIVRCMRYIHRLSFSENGHLFMLNHDKEGLIEDTAMCALACTKPPRCLRVIQAWKQYLKKGMNHDPFTGNELNRFFIKIAVELSRYKKHWAKSYQFIDKGPLDIRYDILKREITKAILASKSLFPDEERKNTANIQVFTTGSVWTTLNPDRIVLNGEISEKKMLITLRCNEKHWLVKVYKRGLAIVDDYPVLEIVSETENELVALVISVSRFIPSSVSFYKAAFRKPMGRQVWWKLWEEPDNGKVWRFSHWVD